MKDCTSLTQCTSIRGLKVCYIGSYQKAHTISAVLMFPIRIIAWVVWNISLLILASGKILQQITPSNTLYSTNKWNIESKKQIQWKKNSKVFLNLMCLILLVSLHLIEFYLDFNIITQTTFCMAVLDQSRSL